MTMMGIGGAIAVLPFNVPTVLPQPSAMFSQSNSYGQMNAGLKTNSGSDGAFLFPPTVTDSMAIYGEITIPPDISSTKWALGNSAGGTTEGVAFSGQSSGQPNMVVQTTALGSGAKQFGWWRPTVGLQTFTSVNQLSKGTFTNYNAGIFPWQAGTTAGAGGCPAANGTGAREPQGIILTGVVSSVFSVDPGFLCGHNASGAASQVDITSIPGIGAAGNTTSGETCAATTPSANQFTVTITTSKPHGVSKGNSFTLVGMTPSGWNGTYSAVDGTGGSTLVGTTQISGGACPAAVSVHGTITPAGTGGSITIGLPNATIPFGINAGGASGTGIQVKPGQRVAFLINEFGTDSDFPGGHCTKVTDILGNDVYGSPACSPWSNQGATNFTGYTLSAPQTAGNPALIVIAMNPYTVTNAVFSGGKVTFTTSADTGFMAGSNINVTGVNPSGFNHAYRVVSKSGTTIVANPLGALIGMPSPISSPGAWVSGGTMTGVIMPGMYVAGATGYSQIAPFGYFGSTGVGLTGSYGLSATQATFTATTSATAFIQSLTVTSTPTTQLVVGDAVTCANVQAGTVIDGIGASVGGAGSYHINLPTTGTVSGSCTFGPIGTSAAPVNMYAADPFYYNIAPSSSAAGGGTTTIHTQAATSDFINRIGTESDLATGNNSLGWGGNIANVGMLYGGFPMSPDGTPALFGELVTKTHSGAGQSLQGFAAANGLSWHSLYRLADSGLWADSSIATFTGHIVAGVLTIDSTQDGSTAALAPPMVVSGAGFVPRAIVSGSFPTYTLAGSDTISSESMTVGNYSPATPLSHQSFNGQIAGSTLTVNSLTTQVTVTASLAAGSNSLVSTAVTAGAVSAPAIGQCFHGAGIDDNNTLCVTGISGTTPNFTLTVNGAWYPAGLPSETMTSTLTSIVPGEFIGGAGINTPVQIIGMGGNSGGPGNYPLSNSANGTIGAETMFIEGISAGGAIAPGGALTVQNTGVGATFPITNWGTKTGIMQFNGLYNAALGTPQHIEAQVCTNAPTCAAAWTGLSSEVIAAGAWSGMLTNVPAGGPYWMSFRASNGTSYATLTNPVWEGASFGMFGEGNTSGWFVALAGTTNQSHLTGQSQMVGFSTGGVGGQNATSGNLQPGPPVLNDAQVSAPVQTLVDDRGVFPTSSGSMPDGMATTVQGAQAIAGVPVAPVGLFKDGTGWQQFMFGGVTQTQTLGVGDGTTTRYSSGPAYGGSVGTNEQQTITASIASTGIMTVTSLNGDVHSFLNVGQRVTSGAYTGIIVARGGPSNTALSGNGGAGTYQLAPTGTTVGSSSSVTVDQNNLAFNGAWAFGATITGTAVGTTLTVNSLIAGNLAELLMVTDGANSAVLTACLTGCSRYPGAGSTWSLSSTLAGSPGDLMTVAPSTGVLFQAVVPSPPLIPVDIGGGSSLVGAASQIKVGTFQILVDGVVACTDNTTFSYNLQVGGCVGANIASAWVNYSTGSYDVKFTTAPASSAKIVAKWINIMSANGSGSAVVSSTVVGVVAQQLDWVGDGTKTSGQISSVAALTGGMNGFFNGQQYGANITVNWPDLFLQTAKANNYVLGSRFAQLHNGQANQPQFGGGQWRGVGTQSILNYFATTSNMGDEQYFQDAARLSEFSASTSSPAGSGPWTAVLTLTTSASDIWESEVLECNPYSIGCGLPVGTEIVSLRSGTWGANGSTYNIQSDISSFATTPITNVALHNAIYYGGKYVGPGNDLTPRCGAPVSGYCVEPGGGTAGALRLGHRLGVQLGAGLAQTPTAATNPTINRGLFTGCSGTSQTSPCPDSGATFQASHAATWSGSAATITGGLTAGQRPFVPGMKLGCTSCNNVVVTGISLPPTQSSTAGQGQVGQTFTIQASGAIGGSGSGTLTGGCAGTAGVSASCIDFKFDINTAGSYGTAAALNTCGVNSLSSNTFNSPWTAATFVYDQKSCQPTGVGAFVRGFRIGSQPLMDQQFLTGSVYDTGMDMGSSTGIYNQSAAFTCNIVSATVVQCVHGPDYTSPAAPVLGQWTWPTYAAYGDPNNAWSVMSGLDGMPGGQSIPYTAGVGYTNGHWVTGGVCTLVAGATQVNSVGYDVVGGTIVNAYPRKIGNGANTTCSYPINFSGSATITGASGLNANLVVSSITAPGKMAGGEVLVFDAATSPQTLTVKEIINIGGTGTYAVSCATTCANVGISKTFTVGATGGTGGAIGDAPISQFEGLFGIGTFDSDVNKVGTALEDNSGLTGNPLAGFFTLANGGYESTGLPPRPFGMHRGLLVQDF